MKATGAIFKEPSVHSDRGDRLTNDICSKNSESNYTIDGKAISFPVVVSNASMLMQGMENLWNQQQFRANFFAGG